jgi:hypothetical protein
MTRSCAVLSVDDFAYAQQLLSDYTLDPGGEYSKRQFPGSITSETWWRGAKRFASRTRRRLVVSSISNPSLSRSLAGRSTGLWVATASE